jgi:SAM-dependent methyltransferase
MTTADSSRPLSPLSRRSARNELNPDRNLVDAVNLSCGSRGSKMIQRMPDRLFADAYLASLYDAWSPREVRDDYDFYLPRIMSAGAVLDVGCGTGTLLHEARQRGCLGRLCGLDPADGMLKHSRQRDDIEWVRRSGVGDVYKRIRPHRDDWPRLSGDRRRRGHSTLHRIGPPCACRRWSLRL